MLWLSSIVLFLLTIYAWRSAQQLKIHGDPSGLRPAYLLAALFGGIGTVCTFVAAVI